ncbi:Cap domain, partial [Globisporangium splendens]
MKVFYSISIAVVALLASSSNYSAFAQQDDNLDRVDLDANELAPAAIGADFYDESTAGGMSNDGAGEEDGMAAATFRGETEVGADADAVTAAATMAAASNEERTWFLYPVVRQDMIMAVISERRKVGLPDICLSSKLMEGAQTQTDDMAKHNFISITGSDGSSPTSRGKAAGFNSTGVAELVGAGYTTAADMISAWMKSPDSSAIVLGNYTHIGPGYTVEKSQRYVYYWSMDFAAGVGEECSGLVA